MSLNTPTRETFVFAIPASLSELVSLLQAADLTYYPNGEAEPDPFLTDAQYDSLVAAYRRLTGLRWMKQGSSGDIQHARPMISLDKETDPDKVEDTLGLHIYTVMPKVDGLGLEMTADAQGNWVQGLTRGRLDELTGFTYGDDVLANALQIPGMPSRVETLATPDAPIAIRGEVYMPEELLAAANELRAQLGEKPFKTTRNAASGILRKKSDTRFLKFLRYVTYHAYDPRLSFEEDRTFVTQGQVFSWLLRNNFEITPNKRWMPEIVTQDALEAFIAQPLPYATDGVVLMVDDWDIQKTLGYATRYPRFALAFKFKAEGQATTLKGVDWAATRTGRIAPTYVFDGVTIDGATVERATAHNWREMQKIGAAVGDTIEVLRANDVIPRVERLIEAGFQTSVLDARPAECPSCGGEVTENEVDLLCASTECPAKLDRLLRHACGRKNLDIDGMGDALAEALVERSLVKNLSDLFRLKDRAGHLAMLSMGEKTLGYKSATKLVEAIEAAKSKPWVTVLHSLGCPGLGGPECKAIASKYSLERLSDLTLAEINWVNPKTNAPDVHPSHPLIAELQALPGVGPVTAKTLVKWLYDNFEWLHTLKGLGLNTEPSAAVAIAVGGKLSGMTFVVSGKHPVDRPDLEALIEANGGKASSSVSKKTTYLVAGPGAGSKLEKAEAAKVKVIDHAGLMALLAD